MITACLAAALLRPVSRTGPGAVDGHSGPNGHAVPLPQGVREVPRGLSLVRELFVKKLDSDAVGPDHVTTRIRALIQ